MPSQKPELPPLKTPKSFSFPSEIQDNPNPNPTPVSAQDIKREDSSSESSASSIPTPSAYTDFLNALTPVFSSPSSAGGSYPKFKFETCGPSPTSQPSSATSPAFSTAPSLKSPAVSLPPYSPINAKSPKSPPALRRLRIPASIKTRGMPSPRTATPLSATPRSATGLCSPFSPSDWKMRYFETPRSATPAKSVSVRQVVTRTVTYKRTPLDPPPKGKRRKTSSSPSLDGNEPPRKEPRKEISIKEICKET